MDGTPIKFREWLGDQISAAGFKSPGAFADRWDFNRSTVYRWVDEDIIPKAEHLLQLAEALGIEPEYVYMRAGLLPWREELERNRALRAAGQLQQRTNMLLEEAVRYASLVIRVPVMGWVPADTVRWTAAAEEEDYVEIAASSLAGVRDPRAARVVGDCLENVGTPNGSLVFYDADPGRRPRNGKKVVVRIGEDVTLKLWREVDGGFELYDGAGQCVYRSREEDDVEIIGVVVLTILDERD